MKAITTIAIFLILIGILGMVYKYFNYIKNSHDTHMETVEVPAWAGMSAIFLGCALLYITRNKLQ